MTASTPSPELPPIHVPPAMLVPEPLPKGQPSQQLVSQFAAQMALSRSGDWAPFSLYGFFQPLIIANTLTGANVLALD